MYKTNLWAVALALILGSPSARAGGVHYGGDENLDACSTQGHVDKLTKGDFLAVKAKPNLKAKRVDKINNGQQFAVCEESADGKWLGIVYSRDPKVDCGVSRSIKVKTIYRGPCLSGWIAVGWTVLDAG